MLLLPLRLDLAPHLVHRLILYFNPRTPVGCAPVQKYSTTVSKFQSTHPSGVRPGRHRLLLGRGAISIHAPQWGATSYIPPATPAIVFQSTHPSGVRLRRLCTGCRLSDFNPRTPVECDHPPRMWLARHAISIHAPREGCDMVFACRVGVQFQFQSTRPVRGATIRTATPRTCAPYFNPRAP